MLKERIGKDAVTLVNIIRNRKNVSEFKIAEKMKVNINNVRNVLYKLSEYNLVSSTRKKDKKKGWYVYYWTFNNKRAKYLYFMIKQKRIDELKQKLREEENKVFFICRAENLRLTYEEALEHNFLCPESGHLMEEEDKGYLEAIKKEIAKLEGELK